MTHHPQEAVEAVAKAPENIWVEDHGGGEWYDGSSEVLLSEPVHRGVPFYQYTRSDLCTPAPDVAELVAALRAVEAGPQHGEFMSLWITEQMHRARAAIAAWEGK